MKLASLRLFVHRLDRAHDFYHRRLGLELRPEAATSRRCAYRLGPVDLIVERIDPDAPEDRQALVGRPTGIVLAVDDLRLARQALQSRGVPFVDEGNDAIAQACVFEDPDGNQLQLVQSGSG